MFFMLKRSERMKLMLLSLIILLIVPLAGCNYENIGDKLYKAGKYDLAIKAYQAALNKELSKPYGHPDVLYFKLGAAYEMKRDYKQAIEMYKMVLKTNPISKLGLEAGKAILRCKANQIVGNPPNMNNRNSGNAPLDQVTNKIGGVFDKLTNAIDSLANKINSNQPRLHDASSHSQGVSIGSSNKAVLRQRLMSLQSQYDRALEQGDLNRAQSIFKQMQVVKERLKR